MTSHLDNPFISGLPFFKNHSLRPLTFTSLSAQGSAGIAGAGPAPSSADRPSPLRSMTSDESISFVLNKNLGWAPGNSNAKKTLPLLCFGKRFLQRTLPHVITRDLFTQDKARQTPGSHSMPHTRGA